MNQLFSPLPLVCIALILIAVLAAEIFRELHSFVITEYEIQSDKIEGDGKEIRIIFLSDLHNRVYGKNNERLLKAIKNSSPDLILIGGDMVVGEDREPCSPALDFVRRLPDICPVVYANGNHEFRLKISEDDGRILYEEYRERLKQCGIIYLENEVRMIEAGGSMLRICALELPFESFRKFHRMKISETDVAQLLNVPVLKEKESQDVYTILLAHNPVYMDAYLGWGSDLILSGHLHGGLVRIPGIGGVVTPQGFFFPKYSGEMTCEGSQTVIVSRGLGSHTLNIRLFNTPELVSINLKNRCK